MPPTLALFAGDPTGIGPEIVAKVISAPESLPPAIIHCIGHRASIEAAAQAAGIAIDFSTISSREVRPVEIFPWYGFEMAPFDPHSSAARRGFMMAGLRIALDLAREKRIDAVCFAPIDRAALRAAGMPEEDELQWIARIFDHQQGCHEIHVLDNIWTVLVGRASSGEVKALSAEDVADAIAVLADTLRRAGKLGGRIGVCAPQPQPDGSPDPHVQADVLAAAVRLAVARGFTHAVGPLPADVIFARARAGGFDGVITTHPEQEPIAQTLMGYERGVTVLGGLPSAVTTTAHGTARDIVGRGIANPWALRNAMTLALRIASG